MARRTMYRDISGPRFFGKPAAGGKSMTPQRGRGTTGNAKSDGSAGVAEQTGGVRGQPVQEGNIRRAGAVQDKFQAGVDAALNAAFGKGRK